MKRWIVNTANQFTLGYKQDIDISTLVLQENEVSAVKWATVDEIRNLMRSGELAKSIDIYFDMFINLLEYPF